MCNFATFGAIFPTLILSHIFSIDFLLLFPSIIIKSLSFSLEDRKKEYIYIERKVGNIKEGKITQRGEKLHTKKKFP